MSKKGKDLTISSEVTHAFMPIPRPPDDTRYKHRVENSYCLEPAERFQYWRARELVANRLTAMLQGVQYAEEQCRQLAVSIANLVRKDLTDDCSDRYKYACQVLLCEKVDQGMAVGCRCLWDHTRDNFATATFESQSLVAVCMVFAMYCE